MDNIKRITISLKITELENSILNKVVENKNINSFNSISKSSILRELILKEYINTYKDIFNDLGVNIENKKDILETIEELGIDNIY